MGANYCLSEEYLDDINAVRATFFVLSFLFCLGVLVAWICFVHHDPNKARWTEPSLFYTADRLPFYVLVIATVHSVVSIFQLTTLGHDTHMGLCTAVAFFTTWLETSTLLISIIAPAHLMLIHCKKTSDWLQDERKRRPVILEAGYILTVTVGSLIAALLPFFCLPFGVNCYGYDPEGQWCWLRGRDENCTRILAGWAFEIVLFFIPTFVAIFLVLAVLVHISIIKFKEQCGQPVLRLLPNQKDQGFTRPMIALTGYLLLFSIVNVISFGIRIDQIPSKADAIILSIDYSLWGFTPSCVILILLIYEWKERGKDKFEGFVCMSESIQNT